MPHSVEKNLQMRTMKLFKERFFLKQTRGTSKEEMD